MSKRYIVSCLAKLEGKLLVPMMKFIYIGTIKWRLWLEAIFKTDETGLFFKNLTDKAATFKVEKYTQ